MHRVLILDTSILCVHLQVPGKETCGAADEPWDYERVREQLEVERGLNATLVLPLAAIIETGNHIAQAAAQRYETAQRLAEIIRATINMESPWAAFDQQRILWEPEQLRELADQLPEMCSRGVGMGDMSIKQVADYYAALACDVEILTGDRGLRAYAAEPPRQMPVPRRRSGPHAPLPEKPPAPRRKK